MNVPHHANEGRSNTVRDRLNHLEPKAQRTYTPTQAVLARSAGIYHWTPEGRRLYDFTSGVLVANLGHNVYSWLRRHGDYMGWSKAEWDPTKDKEAGHLSAAGVFMALPMT